jgi:mannose-6-phosphate isomerase-like protein (cupin superfamily)
MEVDGESWFDVEPGDVIPIAALVPQRIHNSGDADLIFTCVCLPRFTSEGYTSLE